MGFNQPILLDAEPDFQDGPDGLIIRKQQEITADFLNSTADARNYATGREREFMQVASIPTIVVEQWMREGFNIFDRNVNPREIVRRLKAQGLDKFLTTNKRV